MMSMLWNTAFALDASLAASIVTKATVTMTLTLMGVRLARKTRAAVRHLLVAASFAVLLGLSIASFLVPSVPVLELPSVTTNVTGPSAMPSVIGSPSSHDSDQGRPASGERVMLSSSPLSISVLLLAGWAIGAVLFLLPAFVGLWQLRALRRLSQPWQEGESVLRQASVDAGFHRRVNVVVCEAVPGPVSCGVFRPLIMLPMDARSWRDDDLHRSIIHELEHVRRGDWIIQCLSRAVCACYWFHPLVWIGWRQLILEAERACDDAVLRRAESTAYADQLVALAERLSTAPKRSLLAMANPADLATRVAAILDSRQQRGPAGKPWLTLVCVASILLVVAISPLRVVVAARPQSTSQTFAGALIDPLGRPLADTRLTLWRVSTQQPIETRSDAIGRFIFSGMPPGEYRVQVQEFGPQGEISLAPEQHLNRDIRILMGGGEYEMTVSTSEAPTVLPAPPPPLPPPSRTSPPYSDQAALDRCAQSSMFCRVTPPVQVARAKPVYPTTQRERGISGSVVVAAKVGTDGLLEDPHTLTPADPDFASATLDALRRWQFTPIQFDGVPVEMSIRVTVNFVARTIATSAR
jgi:TonB family protein